MNKTLLRKVRDQILAEPKQFIMHSYFSNYLDCETPCKVNCGTAACIGGWAIALKQGNDPLFARDACHIINKSVGDIAKETLRLSEAGANRLFNTSYWPRRFNRPYFQAITQKDHGAAALIAAKRIDYFIKTGK